jgi:uncharacterized protein YbjT (DUF2867 family)
VNLTIFGGTGAVGRLLVAGALERGERVTVLARNPGKLGGLARITVVAGELSDRAAVASALTGADAVISALGPGGRAGDKQLADGFATMLAAMAEQGVCRLVALSTASVEDPGDRFDLPYALLVGAVKLVFPGAYAQVVAMGDVVRASEADWTLVRVGLLTDGSCRPVRTGMYGHGQVGLGISRASLASFMLDAAASPEFVHAAPAVSD